MRPTDVYELHVDETIEASPRAVLDGFIAMYGENRPAWVHRSALDLRVGGAWTVDFGPPGPPAFHEDRVITAYQPARRLAYTTTATYADGPRLETIVEIECEALGRNTRIALTQRGFPTVERRDEFGRAWRDVLALLKRTVERGD
jgi:uncharacterized protein YndB with AHSA1/START domain